MAFLDLEKAFDWVPHEMIWRALRLHQVPEAYVRWTQLPGYYQRSLLPCGNLAIFSPSSPRPALLPLLFILCMDTAMADIQSPHLWTLLYTDNVLLTNEEHQTLNDQMQQWKDRLNENGLQLNLTKAEYMECGPQTIGTTIVDGQDLKKVDCFKYLSSTLSADGDSLPDACAHVNAAWKSGAKSQESYVISECPLISRQRSTRQLCCQSHNTNRCVTLHPPNTSRPSTPWRCVCSDGRLG